MNCKAKHVVMFTDYLIQLDEPAAKQNVERATETQVMWNSKKKKILNKINKSVRSDFIYISNLHSSSLKR